MSPEAIQGLQITSAVAVFGCGILIFYWLITSLLLHWGANLVEIRGGTFGKALLAVPIGMVLAFVISAILMVIPILGQILGLVAGILGQALAMMPIYKTTFGKALGASAIAWVLGFIITIGLGVGLFFVLAALGIFAAAAASSGTMMLLPGG